MNIKSYTPVFLLVFTLCGCSSGQLTREQAQKIVVAGNEIIVESNKYYNSLMDLQTQTASIIYATDSGCTINRTGAVNIRNHENPSGPVSLCATKTDYQNHNVRRGTLLPLDSKRFEADLALLKAFGDYINALAAYTEDSTSPLDSLLSTAQKNADTAAKLANELQTSSSITAAQVSAFSDFAIFTKELYTLYSEKKNIAALINAEGKKQADNLESVKRDIQSLKNSYVVSMYDDSLNFTINYFNDPKNRKKEFGSYEKARDFSGAILTLNQKTQYIKNHEAAPVVAIETFQKAHADLISILNDNITDEKLKQRELKIAQDNLRRGAKDVVEIVKPLVAIALI